MADDLKGVLIKHFSMRLDGPQVANPDDYPFPGYPRNSIPAPVSVVHSSISTTR